MNDIFKNELTESNLKEFKERKLREYSKEAQLNANTLIKDDKYKSGLLSNLYFNATMNKGFDCNEIHILSLMTHVNKALENICKNEKYDDCEKDDLNSEVYNIVKDNNVEINDFLSYLLESGIID